MGSVVISIDAELGWGFHDLDSPPTRHVQGAREGWLTLLDMLDEFGLPATWAVVGHLLVEDCDGDHDGYPSGWFARERGEWRDYPELLEGRDLVRAVQESAVGHELGCHSFSHVEFDTASSSIARRELDACLEVAAANDFEFSTFVFPRNRIGHLDLLAERGFTCYRGPSPGPRVSRARRLARGTVTDWTPPLVTPAVDDFGLVNVPASLYLYSFERLPRSLVEPVFGDPIVRQARRGIDAAARGDGVFHVWLHPNDLVDDRDVRRLRSVLEYLDVYRPELQVETMGGVAERVVDGSPRRALSVEQVDR